MFQTSGLGSNVHYVNLNILDLTVALYLVDF